MPFVKGQSGNPSGRPKEAKNKKRKTFEVAEICERFNCDPFHILCQIAMGKLEDDEARRITPRVRMEAASELAQYLAPKLKSIELSNQDESPMKINIMLGTPQSDGN